MLNTRREFLEVAGVSAASLPFLQNLAVCAPATSKPRQRLIVIFSPNGVIPNAFWPEKEGDLILKEILQPLEPFRAKTLTLHGVCDKVRGDGDNAAQHRAFYDEYLAVMDLTAEFFLQTLKTVFQDHALPEGTMASRGRKVEPRAISTTALMTIEGELDDISGVGQTYAAHAICAALPPDKRAHWVQPGVGHFGIFNGRRWRESILPQLRGFIRSHATPG